MVRLTLPYNDCLPTIFALGGILMFCRSNLAHNMKETNSIDWNIIRAIPSFYLAKFGVP